MLIDLNVRDIDATSPLRHLNHTVLEKDSVLALVKTVNKHIETGQIQEKHLEKSFEALWSQLEEQLSAIQLEAPATIEPSRGDQDVLNDILENVLNINRKVSRPLHRSSDRHIERHHAEILFKRLLKIDIDRGDIEEIMESIVPDQWLDRELLSIFGEESTDDQ